MRATTRGSRRRWTAWSAMSSAPGSSRNPPIPTGRCASGCRPSGCAGPIMPIGASSPISTAYRQWRSAPWSRAASALPGCASRPRRPPFPSISSSWITSRCHRTCIARSAAGHASAPESSSILPAVESPIGSAPPGPATRLVRSAWTPCAFPPPVASICSSRSPPASCAASPGSPRCCCASTSSRPR